MNNLRKRKKCYLCNAELDKIARGLNKKLLGRDATRDYCIECLADYLDTTEDELREKVEDFKLQGCTLFG